MRRGRRVTETRKLIVGSKDACIILREDGEVHIACDITEPMQNTTLLAIGLAHAAENAEWAAKLIARTREKIDKEGIR